MMKLKLDINWYINQDTFADQKAIYETLFELQMRLQKHGYTGTFVRIVDTVEQDTHRISREIAITYDKNQNVWIDSDGNKVEYLEYTPC